MNSLIWSLQSKSQFASLRSVESAVADAVCRFNGGCKRSLLNWASIQETALCGEQPKRMPKRGLCQHWSLQLVECLQLHMPHLANSTEFLNLVDATIDCGYGNDPEVTSRACQILQRVVDTVCTLLPRDILQRCYSLCVVKAGSAVLNERSKFIALMTLLPVDLLTSEALLSSPELQEQALQRTAILSAPGIILTVQGFRTVMSALLLPPPGGGNIDACELRLERLAPARLASGHHAGALWCWALWESAQICVHLKLRTPLGKPQETFTSIEGALKALLADPSPTGIPSLKRAQLLLDFLEHLDKSMYNAYEGSAGSLPAAPKAVRTFFRTNRATCLEWLARVRPRAVRLALRAGRPAEALRHTAALAASAPQGLGAVVRDVATSLVQLHCPEAIWGLYAWGKEVLGQRMPWLRAAAAHAAGRLSAEKEGKKKVVMESPSFSVQRAAAETLSLPSSLESVGAGLSRALL
ncbi:hypothetical protein HPB51_021663 [Rhipicephalus microplus]|uniref:Uncharacterized protein n=1 Tax=Rhipicephalus microplus TaxID=6941 RepID=A0A9J6EUX9_RHIMP|nr:hypothetical protein HPB51_021663 [Rhipicephalus microplus]